MSTGGRTAFLDLLPDEDRAALRERAGARRFGRGAILMHQGQTGEEVIVLTAGIVKLSLLSGNGDETVLGFRGPGDLLGELAVIDRQTRSSTVAALEPVQAMALSAADFRGLLGRPGFALALMRSVIARFRDSDRKLAQFGASHTLGRVAARLVELAEQYGSEGPAGTVIGLALTQEELAGWTGASREAVAKALRTLRELELIATERRRITVRDVDALRRRAA